MKKFLILSLLTLVIPIQVKSHNKPAHEICLKASDYAGCIKTNSSFTFAEKIGAMGVLSSMKCMNRNKGVSIKDTDKATIDALNDMKINIKIRKDSEVIALANEYTYYVDQNDCVSLPPENTKKFEKLLETIEK